MKNYYDILGIKRNASQDEIRKAYRNLAQQFHPDKHDNNSFAEIFKDINEAKQVLLNESRKHEYDLHFDDEKAGVFKRFKTGPVHARPRGTKAGRPFIKRNSGKKIAVASGLSILFALALVFVANYEENKPSAKLISYNGQENPPDTMTEPLYNTSPENDTLPVASEQQTPEMTTTPIDTAPVSAYLPVEKPLVVPEGTNEESTVGERKETPQKRPSQPVPGRETIIAKKQLAEHNFYSADMRNILSQIKASQAKANSQSHCVQIQKSAGSNVTNAFKLAEYLQQNGFIISGRETVSAKVEGIKIDVSGACVKVTVGTYK